MLADAGTERAVLAQNHNPFDHAFVRLHLMVAQASENRHEWFCFFMVKQDYVSMKRSAFFALVALAFTVVPIGPIRAAQPGEAIAVSSGVEYEYIQTYIVARLKTILESELDSFMSSSTMPTEFRGKFPPATHDVKLYRVTYRSVLPELDNQPTVASGLAAIPDTGGKTMPMVSYQHGTVFDKSFVPSNPEALAETRIMIARFASQRYVVIGADYFGRGISDLPDSYLVKDSTRQANYDMLLAARSAQRAGVDEDRTKPSLCQWLVTGRVGDDGLSAEIGGSRRKGDSSGDGQRAGRRVCRNEPLAQQLPAR
jgi:hypothetical protein